MCYLSDPGIIPRNHPEYKKSKNNSQEELKEKIDSENKLMEEKNKNPDSENLESMQNLNNKVINNKLSEFKKNIDRDKTEENIHEYKSNESKDLKDSKKKKVITLFNTGEDDPIFGNVQSNP